jgi:hypothetical protein
MTHLVASGHDLRECSKVAGTKRPTDLNRSVAVAVDELAARGRAQGAAAPSRPPGCAPPAGAGPGWSASTPFGIGFSQTPPRRERIGQRPAGQRPARPRPAGVGPGKGLRANAVLAEAEDLCRPSYADGLGRDSLLAGVSFRMHLVGYFKALDSPRAIAWRWIRPRWRPTPPCRRGDPPDREEEGQQDAPGPQGRDVGGLAAGPSGTWCRRPTPSTFP